MYYVNDSITYITTKWPSQLLQKVEASQLWSWGEAEKSKKFKFSKKIKLWSKFTERACVPCVRRRAPLPLLMPKRSLYLWRTAKIIAVDITQQDVEIWRIAMFVKCVLGWSTELCLIVEYAASDSECHQHAACHTRHCATPVTSNMWVMQHTGYKHWV